MFVATVCVLLIEKIVFAWSFSDPISTRTFNVLPVHFSKNPEGVCMFVFCTFFRHNHLSSYNSFYCISGEKILGQLLVNSLSVELQTSSCVIVVAVQFIQHFFDFCLWKEILSQQTIRHFKISQSIYLAYDVDIIGSYSNINFF